MVVCTLLVDFLLLYLIIGVQMSVISSYNNIKLTTLKYVNTFRFILAFFFFTVNHIEQKIIIK